MAKHTYKMTIRVAGEDREETAYFSSTKKAIDAVNQSSRFAGYTVDSVEKGFMSFVYLTTQKGTKVRIIIEPELLNNIAELSMLEEA
jgi:predicted transcriptional regulator